MFILIFVTCVIGVIGSIVGYGSIAYMALGVMLCLLVVTLMAIYGDDVKNAGTVSSIFKVISDITAPETYYPKFTEKELMLFINAALFVNPNGYEIKDNNKTLVIKPGKIKNTVDITVIVGDVSKTKTFNGECFVYQKQ